MPSQMKKKDQRLEDFMDAEDHADWGGPTRLTDEYRKKDTTATDFVTVTNGAESSSSQSGGALFRPPTSMLEVSHQTVGPRLLRRLGWREGGIAIIPVNATTTTTTSTEPTASEPRGVERDDDILDNLARVHLSERKLRKIKLQSKRVRIPPPKLDQCGLGFEPYKNAPEFQRYREKRKQQARDRAFFSSRGNVYRVSDVTTAAPVGGNDESSNDLGRATKSIRNQGNGHVGEYLSYETVEDFIGKRSAAGFSLRDDEDDAYDDDDMRSNPNAFGRTTVERQRTGGFKVGDEYNTEVYEHESSDDELNDSNPNQIYSRKHLFRTEGDKGSNSRSSKINDGNRKKDVVGNAFDVWAGADQSSKGEKSLSNPQTHILTSDGKPPIAGFVVGVERTENKQRYPGPDVPRDYTIHRHEFGENENPYVLEALSNAVRLERKEERRSQMRRQQQQQDSQRQPQQQRDDASRPLTKNFALLGAAMKNRFTSSTEESSNSYPAGLHLPRPVEKRQDSSEDVIDEKQRKDASEIKITRTAKSFFPNPLVCKRFRVPVPTNARKNAGLIASDEKKNSEATYFEREILWKAKQELQDKKTASKNTSDKAESNSEKESTESKKPEGIDRPSIETLRSIFQASSDESSSEDEDGEEGRDKDTSDLDEPLNNGVEQSKEEKSRINSPPKDRLDDKSSEKAGLHSPSRDDESEISSTKSRDSDDESSRASRTSSRKRRKEKHRRKHRHRRKRRKHKRSRSIDRNFDSDRSSEDEASLRRRERRNKEHKRRRKTRKSPSSRRKSRKRDRTEEKRG